MDHHGPQRTEITEEQTVRHVARLLASIAVRVASTEVASAGRSVGPSDRWQTRGLASVGARSRRRDKK